MALSVDLSGKWRRSEGGRRTEGHGGGGDGGGVLATHQRAQESGELVDHFVCCSLALACLREAVAGNIGGVLRCGWFVIGKAKEKRWSNFNERLSLARHELWPDVKHALKQQTVTVEHLPRCSAWWDRFQLCRYAIPQCHEVSRFSIHSNHSTDRKLPLFALAFSIGDRVIH